MLVLGGELLTRTVDVVRWWKEHFLFLYLASMPSIEEAESEDLGKKSSITLAEVDEVFKKLPGSKALGMDKIRP